MKITGFAFLGLLGVVAGLCGCSDAWAENRNVIHHRLEIGLNPEKHALVAQDVLRIPSTIVVNGELTFLLHANLVVNEVRLAGQSIGFHEVEWARPNDGARTWKVSVSGDQLSSSLDVAIAYRGLVNDPPQASRGLRFIRPDQTQGHIGPEGVYLTSETAWYPVFEKTFLTIDVMVTTPAGWEIVTQGKEITHTVHENQRVSTWQINVPSEALTLVANRFVKRHREWQGVEIATYFFPQDAALSSDYLQAAIRYLEFYTGLLGPYPFPKFAIVENFFPSGIGLPSFTLLGSEVIKRGYTQPYSLGHEIVHSWMGNSVFNDFSKGNWVEGLTTYLANYYYEEIHSSPQTALGLRQRMVYEYSLYAKASDEYPLTQFHHKETRLDNALGYQKAAMVFHMLRRELGDTLFFDGLRLLVAERSGRYAEWNDLERIFGELATRDLRWFFAQWVERPGAPDFRLVEATVVKTQSDPMPFAVRLRLGQSGQPFRARLRGTIGLAGGEQEEIAFVVSENEHIAEFPVRSRPRSIALDPEFDVLRRLRREEIPPMLNGWVTAERRAVVLPAVPVDQEPFAATIQRIDSQDAVASKGRSNSWELKAESLLVMGDPRQNEVTMRGLEACGNSVAVEDSRVVVDGRVFTGPDTAVLVTCVNPLSNRDVITMFMGLSPEAVQPVARLLFFYGWDSYLIFQHGVVMARGMFAAPQQALHASFTVN